MKYIMGPLYLLYKIYFVIIFLLTTLLLYPFFYFLLKKEKWFPIAFRWKRFWARLMGILHLIPTSVKGKEHLKLDGPFLLVANHCSYLDIIKMYRITPAYFSFMGKAELLKWPLFKIFFTKKMDIAVHRGNSKAALAAVHAAAEKIDKGQSVAIFPEGTIPSDVPNMMRFKNGAFKIAIEKQVPIIPVTFMDNWKRLSDPENLFDIAGPGLCRIIIHPPIHTAGLKEEDLVTLRDNTRDIIFQPLKDKYKL